MATDAGTAEKKNGVAILIPVSDSIPGLFLPAFAGAYSALIHRGIAVTYFMNEAVPLEKAREKLFFGAMGMKPELKYHLWIDTDMFVDGRQVNALLDYMEAHPDVDGASALYFRKSDFSPVCFRKTGGKNASGTDACQQFMPEGKNPVEVDAFGLGLAIMRTGAIKEKLLPVIEKNGRAFWFDSNGNSEDINFCLLMKNSGMKLVVLPEITVPHIGGMVARWHHDAKAGNRVGP